MKKLVQLFSVLILFGFTTQAFAQEPQVVTIKELNSYETELTNPSEVADHPLSGVLVKFTAVVVSSPKNSGLASFNAATGGISRIHVFVVDTAAARVGRDGQGMQIVETNFELLENFNRGSVVEVVGRLGFFGSTAQFDAETVVDVTDNFLDEASGLLQDEFAELLNPITITADELDIVGNEGIEPVMANYTKYINQYVKVAGGTITNVTTTSTGRPDWAINQGNGKIYIYDTSLRVRNDRAQYREGYNFRRFEGDDAEGPFVPPTPGSIADVSGFVVLNNDNPNGEIDPLFGEDFAINPWEDGIVWLNNLKNENGVDGFVWPNDIVVTGQPPLISSIEIDQAVPVATPADIVFTAEVTATDAPVTGVFLNYFVGAGDTARVAMTNTSGNIYTATVAGNTFKDLDAVNYFIEAEANLNTRFPFGGALSFFVSDNPVTSISVIQTAAVSEGSPNGASPLVGLESLPVNVTATVVSDFTDGVIAIQDAAEAWSGVFVRTRQGSTDTLRKGDVIMITELQVFEADVNTGGGITYTYLDNLTYTPVERNSDFSALIPDLKTNDLLALPSEGGEQYEGMLIKFSDAKYIELGGFGEFTIATKDAPDGEYPSEGIVFNEDTRSATIGETVFFNETGNLFNTHIKAETVFDEIFGLMTYTFGASKVIPRTVGDFVVTSNDGDFTVPQPIFDFLSPADEAVVQVKDDVSISWNSTSDYDGDDVLYTWVLLAPDSTEIVRIPVNASGVTDTEVSLTIPFETVQGLFDDLSVGQGESVDALWTVEVKDSRDSLFASRGVDFSRDVPWTQETNHFNPRFFAVTLERTVLTDIEDELKPLAFGLDQNFPNPFNPSTQIRYSLAENTRVNLTVYDVLGRSVAVLINDRQAAGTYNINFDARNLASGMYIYRLQAGNNVFTRKMTLIK